MNNNDFDSVVRRAISEELAGSEVLELFPNKLGFLLYEKLYEYDTLTEALQGKDATIILYQYTKFNGHYIILIKHENNLYEIFDPLGYPPDYELKYFPYDKSPQLSTLIKRFENTGGKVIINNFKFERDAERINTCGRWCILRYAFKELMLNEFTEFIKSSKIKSDRLVTIMTMIIKH